MAVSPKVGQGSIHDKGMWPVGAKNIRQQLYNYRNHTKTILIGTTYQTNQNCTSLRISIDLENADPHIHVFDTKKVADISSLILAITYE